MTSPVIYRPESGVAFPLLTKAGEITQPAIAEEPCDCCGDDGEPPIGGCLCSSITIPDSVSFTIGGVASFDPPKFFTEPTHRCDCTECEDMNGTYILDYYLTSSTSCAWRLVQAGDQLCPPPFGRTECDDGFGANRFLFNKDWSYSVQFIATGVPQTYNITFLLISESPAGFYDTGARWGRTESNVLIEDSYDCSQPKVLDWIPVGAYIDKCDNWPASVTVTAA